MAQAMTPLEIILVGLVAFVVIRAYPYIRADKKQNGLPVVRWQWHKKLQRRRLKD